MHAASVNPEPGSNSLKNCILSTLKCPKSFLELICSFYFCLSSILFKELRDSSFAHFLCFVLHLLLFNFQWPIATRSSGQLGYYITSPLPCLQIPWQWAVLPWRSPTLPPADGHSVPSSLRSRMAITACSSADFVQFSVTSRFWEVTFCLFVKKQKKSRKTLDK